MERKNKSNIFARAFFVMPIRLVTFCKKGLKKCRVKLHTCHVYLEKEVAIYKKWHETKHHEKIHWATLATSMATFAFAIIFSLLPIKTQTALAVDPSLTVSPPGYTNIDSFTFTLTGDIPSVPAKYQYRTGGDTPGVWVDFNPPLSTTVTIGPGNINHPNGAYIEGENTFYFQALDSGDVVIPGSELEKKYYYNITPPTNPTNLNVSPSSSPTNSFTFSWAVPDSLFGNPANAKYYYSINALPTETNTTEVISTSVGPLPFATQVGSNMFYVVAKDEAGNIDYAFPSYAIQGFEANTTAPGIPTSVLIDDISDKDTGQYRLVVSWTPPTITDAGNFNGYDVYHSASAGGPFTKIANTPETAYVHTGLTQNTVHYYYIKAIDKTGNASAQSTTVNATADGHYTVPPNVTKTPTATAKSKTAVINWGTSREANSYVEFGKTDTLGSSVGNGAVNYATDHTVTLTNLESSTKYYYKATFTDPDGNTGQSVLGTFTTLPSSTISNLTISDVTPTGMTITFDTNTPSRGMIEYGTVTAYGSRAMEGTDPVTKHTFWLTGLNSDTLYHIRASQNDSEGNTFTSDDYPKTTLPQPSISNLGVESKKNVDSPTIVVDYKTNIGTTTIIRYTRKDGETKEHTSLDFTTDHQAELPNLSPLVEYALTISGEDKFGNAIAPITKTVTTLSDTLPPKVTDITEKKKVVGEGANGSAELTVKFQTSEPSRAVVEATQGIDGEKFDIVSKENSANVEHTITLKLGKPGVPYTYRLKLTDANGNEEITEPQAIVTPPANEGVLDFILGVFTKTFGWVSKLIGM